MLRLSGTAANTYSGATILAGGTLSLGKTAGVAAIAGKHHPEGSGRRLLDVAPTGRKQPNCRHVGDDLCSRRRKEKRTSSFSDTRRRWAAFRIAPAGASSKIPKRRRAAAPARSRSARPTGLTTSYNGTLRNTSSGTGTLALVKDGLGTLTLQGANCGQYTGGFDDEERHARLQRRSAAERRLHDPRRED